METKASPKENLQGAGGIYVYDDASSQEQNNIDLNVCNVILSEDGSPEKLKIVEPAKSLV